MTQPADIQPSMPSSLSSVQRLALVVNAGLVATWLIFWVQQARNAEFWKADFSMLYTGWRMVLEGDGGRLYDYDLQKQYQHRLIPQRAEEGGLLPFNYPPHTAVPAALFAHLSRSTAFYAWTAIQLLLLIRVVYSLVQLGGESVDRPTLIVTFLAFPPLFFTFQLGQVSLLVLLCQVEFVRNLRKQTELVVPPSGGDVPQPPEGGTTNHIAPGVSSSYFVLGLMRGRTVGPALWLVLGSIKPQLMLAPVVVLLGTRRWRILALAGVFYGFWALLATAVLGWTCWPDWLRLVAHSAQQTGEYGIFPLAMYNLKSVLTSLLGEERIALVNMLSATALLLGLAWTLWLWRGGWRTDDPANRGRLALTFWVLLLLNPHVNPSDVVTLALPAVLFLGTLRGQPSAYLAFAVLAVASPMIFALDRQSGINWPGNLSPFRIEMVLVTVWMSLQLRTQRGREPDA